MRDRFQVIRGMLGGTKTHHHAAELQAASRHPNDRDDAGGDTQRIHVWLQGRNGYRLIPYVQTD